MGRPSEGWEPLDGADRQARLAEKKRAQGLRQVTVWVPDGTQEEVRILAERLRSRRLSRSARPSAEKPAERPPEVPAPLPNRPLLGCDVVELHIHFPHKPPFPLREALKAAGMAYQGEGSWTGRDQIQRLSPLLDDVEKAGGSVRVVRV